jgi:hypothetical protein
MMNQKAVQTILDLVTKEGPPEPRVVLCDKEAEWDPDLLLNVSDITLHVLGRSSDMIVFFDHEGKVIGWRDDGQQGTEKPTLVDRAFFLRAMIEELDLPPETRLGRLGPAELPPVGWTHEAVLFLNPVPQPEDILRVWVSPETLSVIQCLYNRSPYGKEL